MTGKETCLGGDGRIGTGQIRMGIKMQHGPCGCSSRICVCVCGGGCCCCGCGIVVLWFLLLLVGNWILP